MIHQLSGIELNKKFLAGELSAEAIANAFLKHIDAHDAKVGAFLRSRKEAVLKSAKALDEKKKRGERLGKLAGIPIGIKDNIHIKDDISSCGSKFLENYEALFDASVIEKLRAEDALFIGKTNLDEFAMGSSNEHSAFGCVKNPWNLNCTPGGSSGGSGAAVAARFCPISLGSDTGGSIRLPASFCGVHGFKPSYGRVSRYGLVAYGSSLDQIGPFAHNIEDLALVMEVLGAPCSKDATCWNKPAEDFRSHLRKDLEGVKIGVPEHFLKDLNSEAHQVFEKTLNTCKELGAEIVNIDLDIIKYSIAVYYILATAEASTNLARFDGVRYGKRSKAATTTKDVYLLSKNEGFGPEVKRRIMLGTFVLSASSIDAFYKQAQRVRQLIIDKHEEAYKHCDIIALPTAPFPAFELGSIVDPLQMYLADVYTIAANLVGAPAISTPCHLDKNNMPWGIQFMGPQGADVSVVAAASALDHALKQSANCPEMAKGATS